MGVVVHFRRQARPESSADEGIAARHHENQSEPMPELLQKCTDLISASIAERIHELGGTGRDVQQIARSAAYAVFVMAAGETLGT